MWWPPWPTFGLRSMDGEVLYVTWQDSVLPAPSVELPWSLENSNHSLIATWRGTLIISRQTAAAGGEAVLQCCLVTRWPALLSSQYFSSLPLQTALPSSASTSLTPTYHPQVPTYLPTYLYLPSIRSPIGRSYSIRVIRSLAHLLDGGEHKN